MAIPKHVFNILNNNCDLVFGKRFKAKYLLELVVPCPAHSDDLSSMYKCPNPYCGPRITQRQAYYYLHQFKENHPYIKNNRYVGDSARLATFLSDYYDEDGFIRPLDQDFREPRKVSKEDFYNFMEYILNTDGFKSSSELYQCFINQFNLLDSESFDKIHGTQESLSIAMKNKQIHRKTFNRYLRDFFIKHKNLKSQPKYKITKASTTKIGYYTEENT